MRVLLISLMCGENGFTKAFKKHTTELYQLKPYKGDGFNKEAQEIVSRIKPDLTFIQIQASDIITKKTVKIIKDNSGFVMNFTGDLRSPIPEWYYEIGNIVDLTCFSNMNDVREFKEAGLGSEYLEIGFDPEIYKPIGLKKPTKDIVFFGNNYGDLFPLSKYRIEMVEFLRKSYGNKFGVYGNGWNKADSNFNNSQNDEAAAYRGSKIAINLSHFDYERYNSDRILRIMGTGVPLCLTKGYKGIEQDYTNGVNLGVWNDFNELKVLIDNYLQNDYLRQKLVDNGCKLVHEKFTFEQMIINTLNLIK